MTALTETRRTSADDSLRARAAAVIPGGMYGHMSVHQLPMAAGHPHFTAGYPQFYERGAGARIWDVDGNEYIDFMCAYGPMIAGYANPEIDSAVAAVQRRGDVLTGPMPELVDYAEALVDLIPSADWAMFAKNGTDATSMAVVVARAATGRSRLLKARASYHGSNAWFTPGAAGITAADRADIRYFEYNDLASLEAAIAAADGDVAGIILTPYQHDGYVDQELVDVAFARGVRAAADRIGAALILDEVRTGFRLDITGAWESIGVRPDLTAYSKAIGNGYSIAALVGRDSLRQAASEIFVTGSFWMGGVGFAAGLATLAHLRAVDGVARMTAAGQAFRDGLAQQAAASGYAISQSGPVTMPLVRFVDDPDFALGIAFSNAALNLGVLLHPWHNMFVSAAHSATDIAEALDRTDRAFRELRDPR